MESNILISQDLSCMGQVSMATALPILGVCGFQPTVLPTALLSTHTGGFGNNTFLDLSDELPKIIKHWYEIQLSFSSIYLGYLGIRALDFWLKQIDHLKHKKQIILIDPVMADQGCFYKGIDQNYVIKMQKLIKKADVITPNLTEAKLLLNLPITQPINSIAEIKNILIKLFNTFSINKIVITGITIKKGKILMIGMDNQKIWTIEKNKIGKTYFGTGDIFASCLLAGLLKQNNLKNSTQIAAKFIEKAIIATDPNQDKRIGPNYAAGLSWMLKKFDFCRYEK